MLRQGEKGRQERGGRVCVRVCGGRSTHYFVLVDRVKGLLDVDRYEEEPAVRIAAVPQNERQQAVVGLAQVEHRCT